MKITVSELIVRYMERLGIEYVFGMPGAHILPVYDSLYDSRIKSVLVKHEQGAAFMAGGYARASGKISACITTAGPGATNLVTGIANAYAEKQPILIIIGMIKSLLKEYVRRDIDRNMVLEIYYVDEIKRSVSGKHRFVISNLKDHQDTQLLN